MKSRASTLLIYAGPLVTLSMTPWFSDNPFIIKFVLLVSLAFYAAGLVLPDFIKSLSARRNHFVLLISCLFFLGLTIPIFFSGAPFLQQFYGTPTRITGYVTYISLLLFFIVGSTLRTPRFHEKLVFGFILTGCLNGLYGLLQFFKLDPVPWENDWVVGTLGNPDFYSTFMGLATIACFAMLLDSKKNTKDRIITILVFILTFFSALTSNSNQGIVVAGIGCAVVSYYFIRSNSYLSRFRYFYLVCVGLIFLAGFFGSIGKGPLSNFLYKGSIAARGDYWRAGARMFHYAPFSGIGLDSYVDWFRRARDMRAIGHFGATLFSDTAHNVLIDLSAGGGLLLIVGYLFLTFFALYCGLTSLRREITFNPVLNAIFAIWLGYQIDTVVSINQLGLAIWGWIFSGVLVAYRFSSPEIPGVTVKKNKKSNFQSNDDILSGFLGIIGLACGFVISIPMFIADVGWKAAITSGLPDRFIASAKAFPQNGPRLSLAALNLGNNGLTAEARDLLLTALHNNPDDYEAWVTYYSIPGISVEEKSRALKEARRLDPLNPDPKLGPLTKTPSWK